MGRKDLLAPGLVALGATCLLMFGTSDFGDDWRPVVEPLDLAEPGSVRATFLARREARYSIGVEVDWGPRAECLLGVRRSRSEPPCEVEPELIVEWAVLANGKELARGGSEDWPGSSWGGGNGIAALLESFVTGADTAEHEVLVSLLSPSVGLANLNPRLVVGLGGGERHADYASRGYAVLAGITGLVVSLTLVLRVALRRRRAT